MKEWKEVRHIFSCEVLKEFPDSPSPSEANLEYDKAMTAFNISWSKIKQKEEEENAANQKGI